jgi:hypothetical protein
MSLVLFAILSLWPAGEPVAGDTLAFGDYKFEVFYRSAGGRGYKITRNGEQLHISDKGQFNVLSVADGKQVYPVEPVVADITGDRVPELVVEEFPLGLRCCWSYSVFSLGKTFSKVAELTGLTSPIWLEDVNGDSVYEFVGNDFTYNEWYASPRVVLGYVPGHGYRFSRTLMKQPAPTEAALAAKAKGLKNAERPALFPVPPDVHRYMLDLFYSGNAEPAWKFLQMSWPREQEGEQEFREQFIEKLKQSPYWKDIQAMNSLDS